ncbi:MAG TPA: protease modulator HflC [Phycisphaerae bacterium]|nr:protease modulator HflC [Phycisphaerae bacterium]HUU92447.1 protease modulator HflC [Phycisphaerae bacterium]
MKRTWMVLLLAVLAVAAYRCLLFVDETEFVIVTQFGRLVRVHEDPGLHVIWPHQSIIRIDRRVQIYDPKPSEFLAKQKKNVDLDVFVCWRVADANAFFQSVGDPLGAEARLHDIVMSELAAEVSQNPREALVSTDPNAHRLDEIVSEVTRRCRDRAGADLGMAVLDVHIKRISLPRQVRDSVFQRMRDERARIASQYRAEGDEEATKIRAEADKNRTATLAAAYRQAEKTRGEAEAEATRIYARAHQADPEFYELQRTLEAYRKVLDEKTTLLLSADSDLLKYLTRPAAPAPDANQP